MDKILQLIDVCKTYPNTKEPAVADMTLWLEHGEIVAMVGKIC